MSVILRAGAAAGADGEAVGWFWIDAHAEYDQPRRTL